jgi:hypothetical protein
MVGPGALVTLMRHHSGSAVDGGGVPDDLQALEMNGKVRVELRIIQMVNQTARIFLASFIVI